MCPYCGQCVVHAKVRDGTKFSEFVKTSPCKTKKCTSNPHGIAIRWGHCLEESEKGGGKYQISIHKK